MARRQLDQILVVDVESTCWDGQPPQGEESEIIEIGACLLNTANGERTEKTSILVRPERSRVSPFCTELTTLTQAQVDTGVSFAEACEQLKRQFRLNVRIWASYGDYDRQMFDRQCKAFWIRYPFGKGHVNVKSLFALTCGLQREIGMSSAIEKLGLPLLGTHHRGDDDAWNIAGILWRILQSARAELLD